jgi:hypothetical protein
MTHEHSFRDLVHWATHRVPGVPAHAEQPAGHQRTTRHGTTHLGRTHQGRTWQHSTPGHRSHNDRRNHSSARPPRVLAAWQRRIAAVFGHEL